MQVTEQHIERILRSLERSSEMVDEAVEKSLNKYPPISHYLLQVDQDILTALEFHQLLVGAAVIMTAFEQVLEREISDDILDALSEKEDFNWKAMLSQKGTFHQKLDIFFDGYPEEDLLAFIEDSLYEDEDDDMTPVGREVIFIKLKTLVDVLFAA